MASDLIYREDAKVFVRHACYKKINPIDYLDEVPSADVRTVVKCLECENALRDDFQQIVHFNQNGEHGYVWCKKEGCCRAEDFFCASGVVCSCGADMMEKANS